MRSKLPSHHRTSSNGLTKSPVRRLAFTGVAFGLALMAGCASEQGPQPPEREFGTNPNLATPSGGGLPTVNPRKAVGWPEGATPVAADGLTVNAFATGLEHPRWLLTLPNGDVLVAESNKPTGKGAFGGVKGWIAKQMMAYAGAGVPSADRITLLRDTDSDGVADVQKIFASGLSSPFGMTLMDGKLYVANAASLVAFDYSPGADAVEGEPALITKLPGEETNHHWTKNVLANPNDGMLYVAVGSNSNIGELGMDKEVNRAAILKVDPNTGDTSVFASGLRNPVGMAWEPTSGALFTVVNERDELGNQLVPDYLTEVVDGAFYGWPYSYWGDVVDERVEPQRPDLVATARKPDYALGAHTASLGLDFYNSDAIPTLSGKALIGQHGSWNREPPSGYKVIAVTFEDGKPVGDPIEVLTGFSNNDGEAMGRPVGVSVHTSGAILVADDSGNTIWRVAPAG